MLLLLKMVYWLGGAGWAFLVAMLILHLPPLALWAVLGGGVAVILTLIGIVVIPSPAGWVAVYGLMIGWAAVIVLTTIRVAVLGDLSALPVQGGLVVLYLLGTIGGIMLLGIALSAGSSSSGPDPVAQVFYGALFALLPAFCLALAL